VGVCVVCLAVVQSEKVIWNVVPPEAGPHTTAINHLYASLISVDIFVASSQSFLTVCIHCCSTQVGPSTTRFTILSCAHLGGLRAILSLHELGCGLVADWVRGWLLFLTIWLLLAGFFAFVPPSFLLCILHWIICTGLLTVLISGLHSSSILARRPLVRLPACCSL
jgi:hypothetical protein